MWRSKVWARDLGPGTMFHQQYARGEEITEDRRKIITRLCFSVLGQTPRPR